MEFFELTTSTSFHQWFYESDIPEDRLQKLIVELHQENSYLKSTPEAAISLAFLFEMMRQTQIFEFDNKLFSDIYHLFLNSDPVELLELTKTHFKILPHIIFYMCFFRRCISFYIVDIKPFIWDLIEQVTNQQKAVYKAVEKLNTSTANKDSQITEEEYIGHIEKNIFSFNFEVLIVSFLGKQGDVFSVLNRPRIHQILMQSLFHFTVLAIHVIDLESPEEVVKTADIIANYIYGKIMALSSNFESEIKKPHFNMYAYDNFAFIMTQLMKILMYFGLRYKRAIGKTKREESIVKVTAVILVSPWTFTYLFAEFKHDFLSWLVMLYNFTNIEVNTIQHPILGQLAFRIVVSALCSRASSHPQQFQKLLKKALRILLVVCRDLKEEILKKMLDDESDLAQNLDLNAKLIFLSAFHDSPFLGLVMQWFKKHSSAKLDPLIEVLVSPTPFNSIIKLIDDKHDFLLKIPNRSFPQFIQLFSRFKLEVPINEKQKVDSQLLSENDFAKILLIKVQLATRSFHLGIASRETLTSLVISLFSRVLIDNDFWPIVGYIEIIFETWMNFRNKSLFTTMFGLLMRGTVKTLEQWTSKNSSLPTMQINFRILMKSVAVIRQIITRTTPGLISARKDPLRLPYFLMDSCMLSTEFKSRSFLVSSPRSNQICGFCTHCNKFKLMRTIDLPNDFDVIGNAFEGLDAACPIQETGDINERYFGRNTVILKFLEEQKDLLLQFGQFNGWLLHFDRDIKSDFF